MSTPDTMRAVEVPAAGDQFELVERPVPEPGPDAVRVAVDAGPGDLVAVQGIGGLGHLVATRGSVAGWASGHAKDREDTLAFSARREVTPLVETFPLDDVAEAYERMASNEARFRVVLEP
jgi:NADPH2:quinone reductase